MTVSESFDNWYDRMKSIVTEALPGQRKGEELDSCVRQVMAQGHDRESAYAICNDTLKADLEKSERDELLGTAREMSKYDPQVPLTYGNLIEYAGVDVKGEDDLELPKSCRRCETATRVKGSFMCPECDPAINEEKGEYELVGSGVQEAAGEDEGETEKADANPGGETRKVYLDHGVRSAPDDALVRSGEKGLYYEEEVDADQKGDPMANGHDLDPATGTGICEATGKEIEAETMQDLTEDCPHCGDALSVFDQKADPDVDQKAYGADVFRVRAADDDDTEYDGDVLGLGVDFPESDVYVDWRREAFPDELEDPHVSIYGSIEDLEDATGNVIEHMETYETPVDAEAEQKGEFDGYTLGTDGDPGEADEVYGFLDALVDAGGDVWQVRSELYVWPDDEGDFPIHDPAIKVIGVEEADLEAALEEYDVEFLSVHDEV